MNPPVERNQFCSATALSKFVVAPAVTSRARSAITRGKPGGSAVIDCRIAKGAGIGERSSADQRAVEASRHAMTQGESALGAAGDVLQNVREALVASGNGVYTDSQRSVLAAQLRDARQQLLAIANRDDGAGGHLFGGAGSSAPGWRLRQAQPERFTPTRVPSPLALSRGLSLSKAPCRRVALSLSKGHFNRRARSAGSMST